MNRSTISRRRVWVALLTGASALAACTPSTDHEQRGSELTGWRMSGGGSSEVGVWHDPSITRAGHATRRLTARSDSATMYGTWMNSLFASRYAGKRIRMSAFTRTAGATQRADFWARVQAPDSPGDGPGLMGQWIPLPATSEWTGHTIVLDVPSTGAWVQYGVGLTGPGVLWFDTVTIDVVGPEVPLTTTARTLERSSDEPPTR